MGSLSSGAAAARVVLAAGAASVTLTACSLPGVWQEAPFPEPPQSTRQASPYERPERITLVPDDYHVPYAGTAEDGRRFFLSDSLFARDAEGGDLGFVGLFLWEADGTFAEVRVDRVERDDALPPGQALSAGADDLVEARLAELGDYVLEPVEVAPFTTDVDGVTFGWQVGRYDDGTYFVGITPGDFIVYYAPWDGLGYDT